MPRKKREKPIEEMHDRELAERLLGRETVEALHKEFDLRDTSKKDDPGFTPSD